MVRRNSAGSLPGVAPGGAVYAHAFAVVGLRDNVHVTDRDYKKFHADARQQPGTTLTPPAPH
jgi:hypothetical protein